MSKKKTALVAGAGGFIGSHLVKRLKREGYWVRGADLKYPEFSSPPVTLLLTSAPMCGAGCARVLTIGYPSEHLLRIS